MNELVPVEGTSTYLTSKISQLVQVYLGCWISLLSGHMRALKARGRKGLSRRRAGRRCIRKHKEAQRVQGGGSMSFHSTHASLRVSQAPGLARGSEGTKTLNTQFPHSKRGPANKIQRCQEAEGNGPRKGHWFVTCETTAQRKG